MLPTLEYIMADMREKGVRRGGGRNPRKPVSMWTEKDLLKGDVVDAMVIILNTTGCSWARESGCTMCGYFNDTCENVNEKDLTAQVEEVMKKYRGEPFVKIFTSGSFINPLEMPSSVARDLLTALAEKTRKICIETRAEYVTLESVGWLSDLPARIEVAMGVESTDDGIRENIINKNMSMDDYTGASRILRDLGIKVKTYLLLKPPLLSERRAVDDCIRSVLEVLPYTDTISVNPVNIQKYTLVDYLHRRGYYRPPWYYSLEAVLTGCAEEAAKFAVRLMSAPSGAGTARGIHNCPECNDKYAEAVKAISLGMTGPEVFERIDCKCRTLWQCDMDTQDAAADLLSIG